MDFKSNDLETTLFNFFDQIKVLMAQETWDNVLLNCTKNELLVLITLHRNSDVNMTMISQDLNIPLNTATGIIARMEKKDLVLRQRDVSDKRVVTIQFTETGRQQFGVIMRTFMQVGQTIMASLTEDEMVLVGQILDKVLVLLQKTQLEEDATQRKVRKIAID